MNIFKKPKKNTVFAISFICIVLLAAILFFVYAYIEPQSEVSQAAFEVQEEPMEFKQALEKLHSRFGLKNDEFAIIIDISEQQLLLVKNETVVKSYPISSSVYGIGNKAGSNQTPLGTHTISHKIGDGAEIGTVFKSRINTGKIAQIYQDRTDVEDDLVTTRIMWLQGMEPGINKGKGIDSHARYIYIHGTPEEGLIGEPASHGCIRMKNQDVVELFNLVPQGTFVEIQE